MSITPVKALVESAKKQITTLPFEAVREAVASGEALLIDIRDIRELDREGRIPGAYHAPRGMLEFWFDPKSPYHKPQLATEKQLVLFCASAWRSALSTKTLMDMGAANVAELDGGFANWKESGGDVEG